MAEEPKSTVFDYERYGVFLRTERQRAGYNRAEVFCEDVSEYLGVKINKEALYRIEKGVQPPTVEQLVAFGLILSHGKGINDVLNKTNLHHCITPFAEYFAQCQGALDSIPNYSGEFLERNESGNLVLTNVLAPDQMGIQYIDEYYLESHGEE